MVVAVLILLALLCWGELFTDSDDGDGGDEGPTVFSASIICEDLVEKELKAPKTAEFAKYKEQNVERFGEQDKFRVLSYVDAENSFGALIRTYYECVIAYQGGDWTHLSNWEIEKLKFDD